jgi:ABC-type bacteriocin/lantibiotic exporter with double-glycine peptidase domain
LDEERLMKVLEVTQLGADLLSMQSGINTDVGENGATLSGGQRKRVHLSRALYQKGDIYLLDSPLSALDPKVAQQLAANILTYLKGSTVIIFSNSTLHWQGVDHVYVLDEGSMVKEGSYASIASKESVD